MFDGTDSRRTWWFAALCVVVIAALYAWSPVWSRDWGWHLATIERLLTEGRLPWDDVFTYTAGKRYEPVHLVFQLGLYGSVQLFGLEPGLGLYRMALAAAFALSLFVALGRRGLRPWAALALTGLVVYGGAYRLMVRPHLFTTLGIVLLLDTLLAVREGKLRHPARLVPLFLVWTNAHPGVVYGVCLALGFVGAEFGRLLLRRPRAMSPNALKRLAGWVGAGVLATAIHPLGVGLYPYLLSHGEMQTALNVRELRPLFALPIATYLLLAAGLLGLGMALAWRLRSRVDPTLALAGSAFAALGVMVSREVSLALILCAFVLAKPLAAAVGRMQRSKAQLVFALVMAPVALGIARSAEFDLSLRRKNYAVRACDWILEHRPEGRLYNTNGVGGYLVYRLAPRTKGGEGYQVYSDGRMPLFYEALSLEDDFAALEQRYAPDILVVDWQTGSPAHAHSCERSPGFRERYALVHVSSGAKVYLKRGGSNRALIERYEYRHLSYMGGCWPGRRISLGRGPFAPNPLPSDLEAFVREIERARAGDPDLVHLP